jgi:integrase
MHGHRTDTENSKKNSIILSERIIKSLPIPENDNKIYYDGTIKGFGIRVTKNNIRSFILNYFVHGRERRLTIGKYPEWSFVAAKERAKELRRAIDNGADPLEQKEEIKRMLDMTEICRLYDAECITTKRKKTQMNDRFSISNYILPAIGKIKIVDVRYSDITRLHSSITQKGYTIKANRVISLLRAIMNFAIRHNFIEKNPCEGIEMNKEEKRERYLNENELENIMNTINNHKEKVSANAIKMLILTGARKTEVLSARWQHFDLIEGIWLKPSALTKQGKSHRMPLSQVVIDLLINIKKDSTTEFVFPNRTKTNHLLDIKKSWDTIRKENNLGDVRIHDLRHTYASILVSGGLSLPVIGALLGHSQPSTTARYSHLMDKPLREATEKVGAIVSGYNKKN